MLAKAHDPTTAPRVAMVAGEASGDLLAGLLLQGLNARWEGLQAGGVGGPRMVAQGFDAWIPSDRLAVHGLVEVIRVYRDLAALRRRLGDRLLLEWPDVFIGVDAPDFNFGLEERLKAGGIPTVHFVSPSIWAWRGGRIHRIARAADHVLCLFPFEPEIYHRAGIGASYVGHPLADVIPLVPDRAAARRALGLPLDAPVVALLPGSRRGEVSHLAPRFARAAALMRRQRPELRFVMPSAPGRWAALQEALDTHAPDLPVQLLEGRSHEALAACDATLMASGTATLEAALFKRPMVVAYAQHPVSHFLMKRMAYQPWISLPNILLREFAVPELVQGAATPEALANEALAWLDDGPRTAALQRRFLDLHHTLKRDTARCATDAIAQVLEAPRAR